MASLAEKLKKIKEGLKTPPKLSDVEKEKITTTFEGMKEILDDTLEIILEKDRKEAFRYTNILVTAIQQADIDFIAGAEVEEEQIHQVEEKKQPSGPVEKPDFEAFMENISDRQRNIGLRSLDCFQQFPEVGYDIVCPDCSMEKMIACIRMEDPSVDPNKDYELDLKMMQEKQDKPP